MELVFAAVPSQVKVLTGGVPLSVSHSRDWPRSRGL